MHPNMTTKRPYGICAITWTIAVVIVCLCPSTELAEVSIPILDKVTHALMFGGITFLWLKYFDPPCYQITGILVLLTIILGLAIELLQGSDITTGRSFDLVDLSADTLGAIGAAFLFWWQYTETGS